MDLSRRIVARYKSARGGALWSKVVKEIEKFNRIYAKLQRIQKPFKPEDIKVLRMFLDGKSGAIPNNHGTAFSEWVRTNFHPREMTRLDRLTPITAIDVIEGDITLARFKGEVDYYRDAIQNLLNQVGPERFVYHGFSIRNPERMAEERCRNALEGVDYLVALFKKKGMERLLKSGVQNVIIVPSIRDSYSTNADGLYFQHTRDIVISANDMHTGTGRFTTWVNEVFLHEFGHYIHLNYLAPDARREWDKGWDEVIEKEMVMKGLSKLTFKERKRFFDVLGHNGFDPTKAARRLSKLDRVKFGAWLRAGFPYPLITEKQFRLTQKGKGIMDFLRNPEGYLKRERDVAPTDPGYEATFQRMRDRVYNNFGLNDDMDWPIPEVDVESILKANPELRKPIDEAIEKLQIVSDYGKTNVREDFAETFVAFLAAPQKLTPVAKFRMQRALSLSGFYNKPVMRLAEELDDFPQVVR